MAEPRNASQAREHFENAYTGKPPWDIGKPQPVFQAAADRVDRLDPGCGLRHRRKRAVLCGPRPCGDGHRLSWGTDRGGEGESR